MKSPANLEDRPIGRFSVRYQLYVTGLLGLGYLTNQIDRNLLSILLNPISREFHLTDSELGLLSGLTFAVFYSAFGFPLGRSVDKWNRRNLIVATQLAFSGFTFLCGITTTFLQLILARVGVAIGESGGYPAGISILTDLFPLHMRARVMAVYNAFAYIGFLGGFLIGGWVGQLWGWRVAFLVAAIPGLMVGLIVLLTVAEPARQTIIGTESDEEVASWLPTLRYLLKIKSIRHMVIAAALTQSSNVAFTVWLPVVLIRTYGVSLGHAGTDIALVFGIGGCVGTIITGTLMDHLGKRDVRWYFWLVSICNIILVPCIVMMLLSRNQFWFLAWMIVPGAFGATFVPSCLAMMQTLAPPRMRGLATSLYMFGAILVGLTLGVQVTGTLSDLLKATFGFDSVRYALLAMALFPLWGALHAFLAAKYLATDLASANAFAKTKA